MPIGQPRLGESSPFSKMEREKEYTSRIVLSFLRHGEKEKAPPPGEEAAGDTAVRLTPAGRKGALKAGAAFRLPEESMAQAVAKGSPRLRAQETAGLVMAGAKKAITGDESLEELREKIDGDRKYGSKIGTDPRLDFSAGSGEFGKQMMAAFKAGRLMEWLVNESDDVARKTHEKEGSSYSRSARNVAEIVDGYYRAAKRFDQLVTDKDYEDTMQRFMGSHQSVTECFLAKAIEMVDGKGERDAFIEAINKAGFGFVEGFQMEIKTFQGGDRRMLIHFQKKDADGKILYEFTGGFGPEQIKEIINEGKKLDEDTKKE